MSEKSREKDFTLHSHKKKKKKHKRKYNSSDSDSSERLQWVEASSISNSTAKVKKKKKKHKRKYSSSDSDSSEHSQWVEASSISDSGTKIEKRDSWMSEESFVPTYSKDELSVSSSRQKKIDAVREHKEREQKIHEERELNPYWKNDKKGLPDKETDVESLSLPSTSVGDGGYSWLKKAYYRIQEQSQREGRSMEEIAAERWGSLKKLTSMIDEAEERMKSHPDLRKTHYSSKNQNNELSRAPFKKPSDSHEYERNFDSSFKFRKPSDNPKNSKILNQFKSSRQSSMHSYNQVDKQTDHKDSDVNDNFSKKQLKNYEGKNYRIESEPIDSGVRIPAWKKSKPPVEKEKEVLKNPNTDKCHSINAMEVPVICSEEDLSKLASRQIKAEIMGNTELARKLKEQLDEARNVIKDKGFAKLSSKKVEEVILTKIDNQGQARPIQTTQEKISDYKQQQQKKQKNLNKYLDDSSKYSLKEMFEQEKLTTADDQMEMFVEASAQCNETAELFHESGKVSKKLSQIMASNRQEEKDIGKAMHQHQKRVASLEKCEYCLDQPHMKKYLIIDKGNEVYLCLPNYQAMTDGHCLIVPKMHVSSFLNLDENVCQEVNDFKNQLRNLFRCENKSAIFLETSMNFRYFPHAVIECIPVPQEEGDMAPFYFKKAIQESEAEWALNKKLIDLTNKGLKHSVPKNLPYFHVEFDPKVHAGYAHVIEDEKYFPRNFGKEVIGGMLDVDYCHLYKNKKEDMFKKITEVLNFEKKWKKFKM